MDTFLMRGEENPRTIILLHGLGVTKIWWHPQLEALSDEFRVIAPDLLGHGSRAPEPFRVEAAAEQVGRLIDSPALLVGISLGGYIAMNIAARSPQKTVGLVLSGSSMNLNGMRGLALKMSGLFMKIRGETFLEEGAVRGFRKRIQPDLLDPVLADGLQLKTAMNAFGKVAGRDYHKMLSQYAGPVLILNGEADEPNRAAESKLLNGLSNARLLVLPECGHVCSLEQPQAFTRAVREFAEELDWI